MTDQEIQLFLADLAIIILLAADGAAQLVTVLRSLPEAPSAVAVRDRSRLIGQR